MPPEEEEKDGMKSMFDALMADFDKHDTNTPLYLRLVNGFFLEKHPLQITLSVSENSQCVMLLDC